MNRRFAELVILVKADAKRSVMLGVLVLVLVGMSARAIFKLGPKKAQATVGAPSAQPNAVDEIAKSAGISVPASERRDRGPIVALPKPPALGRDIFRLNDASFPPLAQPVTPAQLAAKSDSENADKTDQSGPTPQQLAEERVTAEARSLRLKGTLLGASPTAVIENTAQRQTTVITPGQTVSGFKLVEVKSKSVVLEKDGITIEIERALSDR